MTTTPAPSASEQTQRLAKSNSALLSCTEGLELSRRLDDVADLARLRQFANERRLADLESAARPAPGTSEATHIPCSCGDPGCKYDDHWARQREPKGIAGEPGTSQEPINPSRTDRSWPTAERVDDLAREFQPSAFGMLTRFFSFVRERERAGKGEAKAEPAPERNWRDECMTGSKGGGRWWLRWTDDAGLYWWYHPSTGWVGEPQQLTQPTFISRHEAWQHRKTCSVPPPLVMVPEDAPPAAPGDEAAREAERWARRMVPSGAGLESHDGRDYSTGTGITPGAVSYRREIISNALLAFASRFPRPADSRERESEAKAMAMLNEIEWGIDSRCPLCRGRPGDGDHKPTCRLAAVLEMGRLAAVLGKGGTK